MQRDRRVCSYHVASLELEHALQAVRASGSSPVVGHDGQAASWALWQILPDEMDGMRVKIEGRGRELARRHKGETSSVATMWLVRL